MLMVAGAVLILLSVPLTGGDLRRLAFVPIRGAWLLGLALALQIVVTSIIPHAEGPLEAVHVGTYVLAGIFFVLNRRIPGLWILALGGAMNGITIALNGGTLPADPDAVRRAGIRHQDGEFANSAPLENPRLAMFGDNYAIPEGWPFSNVFSIGDVLILLGMAVAVHRICTPPDGRRRLFGRNRRPFPDPATPGRWALGGTRQPDLQERAGA